MRLNLKLFRDSLNKLPKFPWVFVEDENLVCSDYLRAETEICKVYNPAFGVAIADMPSAMSVLLNRTEQLEDAIKAHQHQRRNEIGHYNHVDDELWNVL